DHAPCYCLHDALGRPSCSLFSNPATPRDLHSFPPRRSSDLGAPAQAPPARLPGALASQLDLARLEAPPGLALYENTAWIPTPGTVRPANVDRVPLGSKNPTGAALRADVGRVNTVRGSPSASAPTGPGLVLWSEAFDGDWSATVGGKTLRHVKPFGWANGFDARSRGSVSIDYGGQPRRYGMIALQAGVAPAVRLRGWR